MAIAPEVARLRSRLGALVITGAPPEQLQAARDELASAVFESKLKRLLDSAPPLTAEQKARLSALLSAGES